MINKNELGQGLLEYALILILAVILVIIVLWIFGPLLGRIYSNIMLSI